MKNEAWKIEVYGIERYCAQCRKAIVAGRELFKKRMVGKNFQKRRVIVTVCSENCMSNYERENDKQKS